MPSPSSQTPPPPAATTKPPKPTAIRISEGLVACGLVGLVSWVATTTLVAWSAGGSDGEAPDLEYPAAVFAAPDPWVGDLLAATHAIHERWAYLQHRAALDGVDLDALHARALERLGPTPTAASFQHALTLLLAGLHDGHAFAAAEPYTQPGTHRWPFTLREVDEGILVVRVADQFADRIERGDLLLRVDDRAIDDLIAERTQAVFASTDAARRAAAILHLARWDPGLHKRSFTIRRGGSAGETRSIELDLPRSFALRAELDDEQGHGHSRHHELRQDGIALFRPGDFLPPSDINWPGPAEQRNTLLAATFADFDHRLRDLAGARALVLDLRGNPGGTDQLGQYLVDRLIEGSDFVYFRLSSLAADGSWRGPSSHGTSAPPGDSPLAGIPLAVIVDESTFSTADNVAACLRDEHPDVRVVGRPNGAGSGAPRTFVLPRTGSRITFCTMRVFAPSGTTIEGVPVRLDHEVRWTRADVLEGRDPDLEAAIDVLSR